MSAMYNFLRLISSQDPHRGSSQEVVMKHMKTVLILEHSEEIFDKLTCDVCGAESKWDENWSTKEHEKSITKILLEEEESLPAGGQSRQVEYHICPICFKQHLAKWFESHRDGKPTVTGSVW